MAEESERERFERELASMRRRVAELELERLTLKAELERAESQREVLENLVFGLEKQEERSRREVDAARMAVTTLRREQDDILQHVRQGILTFGRDLRINTGFSRAASELFGRLELAGLTLPTLLGEHAPHALPRYLKLLFDATAATPRLLERVNPLRSHRFHDATGRERVVAFSFARITRKTGDIDKVMVVMEDCTEVHRLNQALEHKRREEWERIERASQILALPGDVFRDFVREARAVEAELSLDLEAPLRVNWKERLRALHSVKGNARALGLEELSQNAHALEEAALALSQRASEARLALMRDHLGSFSRVLADGDELFLRVTGLRKSLAPPREDPVDGLFRSLETLVEREGSLDKLIAITCSREGLTDTPTAPALYRLRSALVQLVRNAVHHGIEDRVERLAAGKPELGTIRIELRSEGEFVHVLCADDGRGVDRKLLIQSAVDKGMLEPEEHDRLDARESLRLMFQPGLSTSQVTHMGAGRGMGMSVVSDAIVCVRGTVDVTSEPGRGTEFRLTLPLHLESEAPFVGGFHEHLGG